MSGQDVSRRIHTEGVREDGTVEGTGSIVETHLLPLERVLIAPGDDGYLRVIADGGGIDYEVRVPLGPVLSMAAAIARTEATDTEPTDG